LQPLAKRTGATLHLVRKPHDPSSYIPFVCWQSRRRLIWA
jgi:hypothetical protein